MDQHFARYYIINCYVLDLGHLQDINEHENRIGVRITAPDCHVGSKYWIISTVLDLAFMKFPIAPLRRRQYHHCHYHHSHYRCHRK